VIEASKEYGALILVDLIPKIYDTPQMIQILNMDGSVESHDINMESLDDFNQPIKDEETGEIVIVNDLKKGKYSVAVDTGPAYKTIREETVRQLTELAAVSPMFEQLSTDLIAKNMNITESEEMTKRIRKQMVKQNIVDPTEDEIKEMGLDQPQPPSADEQALVDNVNMQTTQMQADIENKDADTQKKMVETQETTIDSYKTLVEAFEKQVALGVPLSVQQQNLLITQGDIVSGAQDITEEGQPNSAQAADIAQKLIAGEITEQELQ
jgi:hypothetical protein